MHQPLDDNEQTATIAGGEPLCRHIDQVVRVASR